MNRAQAESTLVSRARGKMAIVSFNITATGNNADLDDPLITAYRDMGLVPLASKIGDADLALIGEGDVNEYYTRAEMRLLENILGNFDLNDIAVGPRRESLSQLAEQCEKRIDYLREQISENYTSAPELTSGSIQLNTQTQFDDTIQYP